MAGVVVGTGEQLVKLAGQFRGPFVHQHPLLHRAGEERRAFWTGDLVPLLDLAFDPLEERLDELMVALERFGQDHLGQHIGDGPIARDRFAADRLLLQRLPDDVGDGFRPAGTTGAAWVPRLEEVIFPGHVISQPLLRTGRGVVEPHPVLIRAIREHDILAPDEPVTRERPVIHLVLPPAPFSGDFDHVRVLPLEGPGHCEAAVKRGVLPVEFGGVAALIPHGHGLVRQKGVEQDGTITVLQNAQAQVGIFIIPPPPAVPAGVVDQDAGVNPGVEREGLADAPSRREVFILEAGQPHVHVTVRLWTLYLPSK